MSTISITNARQNLFQLVADVNNLPDPFINYEEEFLSDRTITTYDCKTDGAYQKNTTKIKKKTPNSK